MTDTLTAIDRFRNGEDVPREELLAAIDELRQIWLPIDQTIQCTICGWLDWEGGPHPTACPIGYMERSVERRTLRWRHDDPREHFDKRGRIIVVGPEDVFRASVETKNGWAISLNRQGDVRKLVKEDERWPREWRWIKAPG